MFEMKFNSINIKISLTYEYNLIIDKIQIGMNINKPY